MKRLIRPEFLYSNETFIKEYAVLVEDDYIMETGPADEMNRKYPDAVEDIWENLILVPGTVNIHNHCFQSLLRGLACDRPFLEWRDKALYAYSNKFTRDHIYQGAVFAFSEMMRHGVTTVCDFFYLHHFGVESDELIIQAAKDVGIRLVIARTMYDWTGAPKGYVETVADAVANTRTIAKRYNGKDDMVKIIPAPHSLHAASPAMIQAGHQLAKELGTGFHIHIAEEKFQVEDAKKKFNGKTHLEILDSLGVVDETLTIVHGVWLKDTEVELLGERGGSLAYCPSSNMFLADGITDLPAMLKNHVTIGLGSDGACSNNRNSVFEEMRMAALLQKANTCDAMCVNYKDVFRMGTENGGKILGIPVGKIEKGYKADFVGITAEDLSMQPISESLEQLLPNIVYSMQPSAIRKVMVNGTLTVNYGKNLTIPEEDVIKEVKRVMKELKEGSTGPSAG